MRRNLSRGGRDRPKLASACSRIKDDSPSTGTSTGFKVHVTETRSGSLKIKYGTPSSPGALWWL